MRFRGIKESQPEPITPARGRVISLASPVERGRESPDLRPGTSLRGLSSLRSGEQIAQTSTGGVYTALENLVDVRLPVISCRLMDVETRGKPLIFKPILEVAFLCLLSVRFSAISDVVEHFERCWV